MIKDVLRLSLNKSLKDSFPAVISVGGRIATFTLLGCVVLTTNGCKNAKQVSVVQHKEHKPPTNLEKVSFPKVILRFDGDSRKSSKLAELDFSFYGKNLNEFNIESQRTEIRNLILIHFANSESRMMPKHNTKVNDPKLSYYLNQFLSKGRIVQSEYKLVRVY